MRPCRIPNPDVMMSRRGQANPHVLRARRVRVTRRAFVAAALTSGPVAARNVETSDAPRLSSASPVVNKGMNTAARRATVRPGWRRGLDTRDAISSGRLPNNGPGRVQRANAKMMQTSYGACARATIGPAGRGSARRFRGGRGLDSWTPAHAETTRTGDSVRVARRPTVDSFTRQGGGA